MNAHPTLVAHRFTEGKVTSFWFVLREEDKHKTFGEVQFKSRRQQNTGDTLVDAYVDAYIRPTRVDLVDGFRADFDAFKDAGDMENMMTTTFKPCLHIIFRCLKKVGE